MGPESAIRRIGGDAVAIYMHIYNL
jgi:hypothetical protein